MSSTASKREKAAIGKQQTRLNFKNVRKNASASLKPSKPTLGTAGASSKATTKTNLEADKKQARRASDGSSIELDEPELEEEVSEPEGTEPSYESVRSDHHFPLYFPLTSVICG